MPMKNPPHPGGFVLHQCIEPLGLTIAKAADALGGVRAAPQQAGDARQRVADAVQRVPAKRVTFATSRASTHQPTPSQSPAIPSRRSRHARRWQLGPRMPRMGPP